MELLKKKRILQHKKIKMTQAAKKNLFRTNPQNLNRKMPKNNWSKRVSLGGKLDDAKQNVKQIRVWLEACEANPCVRSRKGRVEEELKQNTSLSKKQSIALDS